MYSYIYFCLGKFWKEILQNEKEKDILENQIDMFPLRFSVIKMNFFLSKMDHFDKKSMTIYVGYLIFFSFL